MYNDVYARIHEDMGYVRMRPEAWNIEQHKSIASLSFEWIARSRLKRSVKRPDLLYTQYLGIANCAMGSQKKETSCMWPNWSPKKFVNDQIIHDACNPWNEHLHSFVIHRLCFKIDDSCCRMYWSSSSLLGSHQHVLTNIPTNHAGEDLYTFPCTIKIQNTLIACTTKLRIRRIYSRKTVPIRWIFVCTDYLIFYRMEHDEWPHFKYTTMSNGFALRMHACHVVTEPAWVTMAWNGAYYYGEYKPPWCAPFWYTIHAGTRHKAGSKKVCRMIDK